MEFQVVYLEAHDLYCLMIVDEETGKYFKAKDYEEFLQAIKRK